MASEAQVEYIEGLMAQRGLDRADLAAVHASWGKYETASTGTVSRILAWLKGEDLATGDPHISRSHGMMVMGRLLDERDALQGEIDQLRKRVDGDDDVLAAARALRKALELVCYWVARQGLGDQLDAWMLLAAENDPNSREVVNFFVRRAAEAQAAAGAE